MMPPPASLAWRRPNNWGRRIFVGCTVWSDQRTGVQDRIYRAVGHATSVDGVGTLVLTLGRRGGAPDADDADTAAAEWDPSSGTVVPCHHLSLHVNRVLLFFTVQHHRHAALLTVYSRHVFTFQRYKAAAAKAGDMRYKCKYK